MPWALLSLDNSLHTLLLRCLAHALPIDIDGACPVIISICDLPSAPSSVRSVLDHFHQVTTVWYAGMPLTGPRQCTGTHGMPPTTATPLSPSSWSASGRQAGLQARCCLPENICTECMLFRSSIKQIQTSASLEGTLGMAALLKSAITAEIDSLFEGAVRVSSTSFDSAKPPFVRTGRPNWLHAAPWCPKYDTRNNTQPTIYEMLGGDTYARSVLELRRWKALRALEVCQVRALPTAQA